MKQILLSDGQWTSVDVQDFHACLKYQWTTTGRDKAHVMTYTPGEGKFGGKRTCLYLHQFIAQRMRLVIPDGCEIDHKDTNSLNNQRENLRAATPNQQRMNQRVRSDNTLGIKGVRFDAKCNCYRSEIQAHGRRYYFGPFATLQDAVKAYSDAAIKLHGDFAQS